MSRRRNKRDRAAAKQQEPRNPGYKEYKVKARTAGQLELLDKIQESIVTLCSGPPGSGKTFLATYLGVKALKMGKVKKLLLTRPAVEASATLGFLPGDLTQKMAAFLVPLFDELSYFLEKKLIERWMNEGVIEICPVGFFRGRTLKDTYAILDEGQNCTLGELRTILSRVGEGSQLVIVGDTKQCDIPNSGFRSVIDIMDGVEDLEIVRLKYTDVVRSQIVIDMENRFNGK